MKNIIAICNHHILEEVFPTELRIDQFITQSAARHLTFHALEEIYSSKLRRNLYVSLVPSFPIEKYVVGYPQAPQKIPSLPLK